MGTTTHLWRVHGYLMHAESKPALPLSELIVCDDRLDAMVEAHKRWSALVSDPKRTWVRVNEAVAIEELDGHRIAVEPVMPEPLRQLKSVTPESPKRPVMRYHGGKWKLAPWVLSHFPAHEVYVEPYCGAASVLMRKRRSKAEIINDLDDEIVNVFRVLRDPDQAQELERVVRLTPYSRAELNAAYEPATDPIERARRVVVKAYMGFGTTSMRRSRSGFRARMYRGRKAEALDFAHWPDHIASFVDRLRGVLVECKPALSVIAEHDGPTTLFYCDPPYVFETRTSLNGGGNGRRAAYAHEMSDEDHRELAGALKAVRGMVVISGYACPLYDELYAGWERVEHKAWADGANERTECLWLSPRVSEARRRGQLAIGI